ncbi:MAG: motB [Firmicutes bacterium]|nr:motB [Bacillota bacterium]
MKKKRKSGGANWMDTYGDMVTLLLCFFVLLYSMSTLDQQKWIQLVRSFNPDAIPEITEMQGNDGPIADPAQPSEDDIDLLFQELQEYIAAQNAQDSMSVTQGDGYVFLSLNDAVFFDGDSYVLRNEGKLVLDAVGAMLGSVSDSIDELRILGHTAQAEPNRLNDPMVDRMLSTNRANRVLVYLQGLESMKGLHPARMIAQGHGQWRPISSNDTGAERARNRRVEIIVTGRNVDNTLRDSLDQYYTDRNTDRPENAISYPDEGYPASGTQETANQTAE